jgi:hypothetical protein
MLLNNAQKRLIDSAIKDYYFIKSEIEEKIKQNYDADRLKEYLNKLKGIEIYQDEDDYIDFYYNDLNLTIVHNEKKFELCNSVSIYDKNIEGYLFECVTIEAVEEDLKRDIYEQISQELKRYKQMKESKFSYDLESRKQEIITFILENL